MKSALVVLGAIYFAPSLVAIIRRRKDAGWVILFNILAGWSGAGWIAAMFWAV